MGELQQKKMSPGHGSCELAAAQSLYKLESVDQPFTLGQGGDMKPLLEELLAGKGYWGRGIILYNDTASDEPPSLQ